MRLNPYLSFNGQCKEAFEFYQRCLGGEIVGIMTYGDTPMADQFPTDYRNRIAHARIVINDQMLMASDAMPGQTPTMSGFSVSLMYDTSEEADRVFEMLAEGGTIHMPIEETFWAHRFGMLVDQFGTPWMVNCEKPL